MFPQIYYQRWRWHSFRLGSRLWNYRIIVWVVTSETPQSSSMRHNNGGGVMRTLLTIIVTVLVVGFYGNHDDLASKWSATLGSLRRLTKPLCTIATSNEWNNQLQSIKKVHIYTSNKFIDQEMERYMSRACTRCTEDETTSTNHEEDVDHKEDMWQKMVGSINNEGEQCLRTKFLLVHLIW